MPVSEAKKRANKKYTKKTYDRIEIKVKKGKKAEIQSYADEFTNGSINKFVCEAIEETIKNKMASEKIRSEEAKKLAKQLGYLIEKSIDVKDIIEKTVGKRPEDIEILRGYTILRADSKKISMGCKLSIKQVENYLKRRLRDAEENNNLN